MCHLQRLQHDKRTDWRKKLPASVLKCDSRGSYKARKIGTACGTPSIRAEDLERRVWEEIEKVIRIPRSSSGGWKSVKAKNVRRDTKNRLGSLTRRSMIWRKRRAKYETAFQRDIYTLDAFAEKMKDVRARMQTLEFSKSKLQAKINETKFLEEQKKVVLAGLERIRQEIEQARQAGRTPNEIPFLLKRRIVTHIVETYFRRCEQAGIHN